MNEAILDLLRANIDNEIELLIKGEYGKSGVLKEVNLDLGLVILEDISFDHSKKVQTVEVIYISKEEIYGLSITR